MDKLDINKIKDQQKIIQSQRLLEFQIIGGGNIKSTICQTCSNNTNQDNKDSPITQHVDQTTTYEQREYFKQNIENQVDNLKSSSGTLKNQNSKVAFTQSINWINSHQLVVFDIILGLKASDQGVIETFEDCISKLLDSIVIILKKSKNVYLGFLICCQTTVLVTGVYRYYLSHPMDQKKCSKIVDLKQKIMQKIEEITQFLEKLKENDMSINYLEQSLKIIESFTFALPDNQSFQPILNFASGLGKMILTGGTVGISEMFSGIKEGLSLAANKKIHEEQIDNYIMYVNLEKIKFSIIKILFDKEIDNKDEQIKQTLQSIGKSIEKSSNWFNKYFFAQILSELILYQPQIDQDSLQKMLTDQKFSYDFDIDQIWELLVKNNWVTQFKLEDGAMKVGYLNFGRSTLDEINIDLIRFKDDSYKKQDKKKIKPKNKGNPTEIIQNFALNLNQNLKNLEPISSGLRDYMLKGDYQFKGLLSYCFEGLEEYSSPQSATQDFFSGKDPIDIIQISIEKILNFAIDFFKQQFTNITKNSESQLRIVFVASLKDYSEDITNYIFTKNLQFESILDVNPSLKNFTSLYTQLDNSLKKFVLKIQDYSNQLSESLGQIQEITNCFTDNQKIINSVQSFLGTQSHDFFKQIATDITNKLTKIESSFEQLQKELNLESFETKEQTTQILKKSNSFVQQYEDIMIQFQIIQVLDELVSQYISFPDTFIKLPDTFIQLKFLLKKIQAAEEKDPKLNKNKVLVSILMKSNQFEQDLKGLIAEINDKVKIISKSIQKSSTSIILNQGEEVTNATEDKIYFCIKMINEFLKRASNQFEKLSQDLEILNYSTTLTHAQKWTQLVNDDLKHQVLNKNLTRESLKTIIVQQADQIENSEIQDEQESAFMASCNQIYNIFNELSKITSDIFNIISDSKKQLLKEDPGLQDKMIGDLMLIMGDPLIDLKSFMTIEMGQMKERLVDDIQGVFKEFQNNQFAKSIGETISSLKSVTSFVDLGGLASTLFEKYADQNWRIRDRIVLILFDLNRISGGENDDQIYANTLIQMKAKDPSLKVQQTLKNEELLLEMKSILTTNWKSQEAQIKTYIKKQFEDLDSQVEKMKLLKANKEQMLKMYERSEAKLNQQLENISDIGQMAGIQLEFLKDLKKKLFQLTQDVAKIINKLEIIEDQMTLLKGKSIYQLFLDRQQKVFNEQKQIDLNVQLKVCEYQNGQKKKNDPKTYNIIDEKDYFDDVDNPDYTTVLSQVEKIRIWIEKDEYVAESEKEQVLPQDQEDQMMKSIIYNITTPRNIPDELFSPDKLIGPDQLQTNQKKQSEDTISVSSVCSVVHSEDNKSPEESFVFDYHQNNENQVEEEIKMDEIAKNLIEMPINQDIDEKKNDKKHKKKSEKKPKKKANIIDKFLDPSNKKNSLLLHGIQHGSPGPGCQRSSQQIECYIWKQRRMQRAKVIKMLLQPSAVDLRAAFKDKSLNDIFDIMQNKNLIDKNGYFMPKFIDLEGKLEETKFVDTNQQNKKLIQINKESEDSDQTENEQENEKPVQEPQCYLNDIVNEKSKAIFQTELIDMMKLENDQNDKLCKAIYMILDEQFQSLPIPIYIDMDHISDPKKLINETLQNPQQYGFTELNIRQFTSLAKSGDLKLIFIISGYENLKQQIGLNLFNCNEFYEFRPPDDHEYLYPKVITTANTFALSGNYESNFYNIFEGRQMVKYFPEQFYVEYYINNLNKKQIFNYLQQKFISNFKELLYKTWYTQYFKDGWYKNEVITNQIIQQHFDEIFYPDIEKSIHEQKIYNQTEISKDYTTYLIDSFKQKMAERVDSNESSQYSSKPLKNLSSGEWKIFKMKLQNIVSKKYYITIIKKLQIIKLFKTQRLLTTFINRIDDLIKNYDSFHETQERITNILKQEGIITKDMNICINDIINLLKNFLDNQFNSAQPMDKTEQKVEQMLKQNAYFYDHQDTTNNLTRLIVKALYDINPSRYYYYTIFLNRFINEQIAALKREGKLIQKQNSMIQDCWEFVERLANAFQREGIEQYKYQNSGQLYVVKSQWDEFFEDNPVTVRKQVRDCLPLICEDNLYSFLDPSIKNYILSKQYYTKLNKLQISFEFYDQIFQFKQVIQQIFTENQEVNTKQKSQKNQNTEPVYSKQQLIDIDIKQTQETMKIDIQDIKMSIQQLQKKITQGDNQYQKQQDKTKLYTEELVNNLQLFHDFVKFYKKNFDKNMLENVLQEKIQDVVKQLKNIAGLQQNQQPDLYSVKNIGVCEFLWDRLRLVLIEKEYNHFMKNLITIIKIAKYEKDLQLSACNAMGILIYSQISFNDFEFSGLDLSNANFYGGQFYRCVFKDCNMTRVNLSYSIMHKCLFINTNLSFAILGNACLLSCEFTNNTTLKRVNLMRSQDIDYNKYIDYKEKETGKVLKDPLVYAMISPFDQSYLLAFHTYQVFIIYIQNESSKLQTKKIKSFQQPFTRCGMIEFNYNNKPHLIAGQEDKIVLIDIQKMQIVKTIQLDKIVQITSLNINQMDDGILIGGVDKDLEKYIELMYLESEDSKVIVEECDLLVIDKLSQLIICHTDDKHQYTATVVCLNLKDYKQIGQKQYLHTKLGYIQDQQLQKSLKLSRNKAFDHPLYQDLHIQMNNTDQQVTDVKVSRYNGTYTNQNGEVKPNIDNLDYIRILQKDVRKYGRHLKIVLNLNYSKQFLILSEQGLIQRLNFINEKQNYDLDLGIHQQLNHIQFFINVTDQDKQFLACSIKHHFNGIIRFRKLQFDANKQNQIIYRFQIMEEYDLIISGSKNVRKQLVIRHEVLKMQNHEQLLGYFIVVVQENQNLIKVFVLNVILSKSDPTGVAEFQLKDLTKEGELFSSFEIHPKSYKIFCFFYNQTETQCPQSVIFNVEENQQLAVIKFEMSPNLWQIHIENNSNFSRMFLYNQFGQIKVYNDVGYSYKVKNDLNLQGTMYKSNKSNRVSFQNLIKSRTSIVKFEDNLFDQNIIEPEHESIFYDSIESYQCIDIIGFRPNFDNKFLYFFDFWNHKFIQYDTQTKEKIFIPVDSQQKFINNCISSEKKQRKTCETPKTMKIDYFANVKQQVDEYFKNKQSSLEQAVDDQNYKEILTQYRDQMQLIFHPKLPHIFIVFKEQKVIIVYNIDKKSIIQLIKIPLYFDKQYPFNMTLYNANKNMLICSYYQTIDVYMYQSCKVNYKSKQEQEEFINIYTRVFEKSNFSMDNSHFKNCTMYLDTLMVLQQNGAIISSNDKNMMKQPKQKKIGIGSPSKKI